MPRCRLFLLALLLAATLLQGQTRPQFQLITSDIDNFWEAYDAGEPGNRAAALQRLYFDRASPGLQDFIRLRIGTAADLAAAIEKYPKYYASIRALTQSAHLQRQALTLYLTRFQGLYPQASFPPIYLLIGRLNSGGTISNQGLLIGTEVFSLGEGVDTAELAEFNPAFLQAMGPAQKLPHIIAHELVHAQIRLRTPPAMPVLLRTVLLEGAADLIANLVSGRTAVEARADYAQANREDLFRRFAQALTDAPDDLTPWLYNYTRPPTANSPPADLGYWLGEEICRDYLALAADRQAALDNLLSFLDPAAIVRESSYAYLLNP